MTAINPIAFHVFGFSEARMTDAEAKYLAEEAADDLAMSLSEMQDLIDSVDKVPFGDASRHLDKIATEVHKSLTALAEVKSALSKIKVRETADAQ